MDKLSSAHVYLRLRQVGVYFEVITSLCVLNFHISATE